MRNEQVLRMFLLSALEPADARSCSSRIAASTAGRPPSCGVCARRRARATGPAGFGQLAAEYGLRQYDAVHDWALWAIDQLDQADHGVATTSAPSTT